MIFSRPAPHQSKSSPPAEQVLLGAQTSPNFSAHPPPTPQVVVTLLRSKGPAQPRGADQPLPAEPRSMQHDAAPTTVRPEAQGLATRTQPRKAVDAFPERSHPPLDAPGMFDPRGGDGYVQASSRSTRNFRRSDVSDCPRRPRHLLTRRRSSRPWTSSATSPSSGGSPSTTPGQQVGSCSARNVLLTSWARAELDSWKTKALYGPGIQELQFVSAPRQPERPRVSRSLPGISSNHVGSQAMLPREQPVVRDGENFLPFRDSIVSKVLGLLLPPSSSSSPSCLPPWSTR